MKRGFAYVILALLAVPALAAEVAYRQVDADNFVFRLRNKTALTEQQAQAAVAGASSSVCRPRAARLGKFSFRSTEAISDEAGDPAQPGGFEFIQEVSCVAASTPAAPDSTSGTFSKEEKDGAAAQVLDLTERYFRLLGEGKVDDAFKDLSPAVGLGNESSWKQSKREFQATAGALQRIEITKVTIYENPSGASEPGLYAAADYRNVWQNVPIHCGYLVWFRTAAGRFLVTREETGHATSDQLKTMTPQQQQQAVQALRCR